MLIRHAVAAVAATVAACVLCAVLLASNSDEATSTATMTSAAMSALAAARGKFPKAFRVVTEMAANEAKAKRNAVQTAGGRRLQWHDEVHASLLRMHVT